MTDPKAHILFVCGKNQWRSPTAERLYRGDGRVDVRSAGVSARSRHQISAADIGWADLILVMEEDHKARILEQFRSLALPAMESLDIPDEYEYMDDELVDLIRGGVEARIEALLRSR